MDLEDVEMTPEFLEIIKNDTIKHLKKNRNELLQETDKYLLADYPITPEQLEIVKAYRQQLRDFTKNDYRPDFIILIN